MELIKNAKVTKGRFHLMSKFLPRGVCGIFA